MIAETCLALAIYWEARNQSTIAKVAVAEVVLHRTMSEIFPNDWLRQINVCVTTAWLVAVKEGPRLPHTLNI